MFHIFLLQITYGKLTYRQKVYRMQFQETWQVERKDINTKAFLPQK